MGDHEFSSSPVVSEQPTAMQVFLKWERLRLIYNLILTVVVIGWIIASWDRVLPRVFLSLPIGAIMANVCFCAGPVAENFFCWWGDKCRDSRLILFVIGTLFAIVNTVDQLNILISFGGLGS